MDFFWPTARLKATIGVEQNSPILTPGVANRASSEATTRSQVAASWQPAAVATPWNLRYDGLRYLLNGLHQLAADVEEVTVESGILSYHL